MSQFVLGIGRSNGCARLQVTTGSNSVAVVRQGQFLTLTVGANLDREDRKKFSTHTHECKTVAEAKAFMSQLASRINAGCEAKDVSLPS